ncbi:unnamed protein product [Fraxinus pennsylvanica]|uniref:Uncharacterized protein n=1 Tax=Fraxinus pennsylvanica TaxID=56036 RepID=A0AAD2AFS4_9LAMI|nr:unnamed protein product [Fraxinus pennsylvanica]
MEKMADVDKEIDVEANYQSEASTGEKRKRDGKSGTTHLLRHISDGICPIFKQEKKNKSPALLNHTRTNGFSVPWKYNLGPTQQPADVEVELLPEGLTIIEHQAVKEKPDDNGVQKQTPSSEKLPQQSAVKSHPKVEPLMNEVRACLAKLAEFTNIKIPMGSLTAAPVCATEYSIATALKCLNEMVDIPQSSDMYLDAFEILQDECERECFICLPPEPRRRWMQRMLHRRHPLSYSYSI